MLKYKIISLCFLGLVYSQCEDYNQSQCNNDEVCEWVYDISYGNCGNLTVGQCYNYPGECYVDSLPGWYDSSGPYCTGGTYQIDNSYCQEIQMPECSEMPEGQCDDNEDCEWIEDIANMSCSGFTIETCNMQDGCFLDQDCDQWGSWYSWICYDYGPLYCSGSYESDNSYCQEVQMPECSEMPEGQCDDNEDCEWVEDIQWGNCSNYNNGTACDANDNCYWDLCYGGSYGSWSHCCIGGAYQIDNGYCEEDSVEYLMGDINNDFIINILDVIEIINLILEGEHVAIADMNYDHNVNVLDIIVLVNIILNN